MHPRLCPWSCPHPVPPAPMPVSLCPWSCPHPVPPAPMPVSLAHAYLWPTSGHCGHFPVARNCADLNSPYLCPRFAQDAPASLPAQGCGRAQPPPRYLPATRPALRRVLGHSRALRPTRTTSCHPGRIIPCRSVLTAPPWVDHTAHA